MPKKISEKLKEEVYDTGISFFFQNSYEIPVSKSPNLQGLFYFINLTALNVGYMLLATRLIKNIGDFF